MHQENKKLIAEIVEILDSNGSVSQRTRDRLMLAGIVALMNSQEPINERLERVEKYIPYIEAAKWLTVTLGVSVIALIWALITGQATIVFAPYYNMANVIIRELGSVSRNASVRIVPLGDVHIGSAACDEEQFKRTVKYIKDEGVYWVGMGDYCEFINKKDPRFDISTLAEWIGRQELVDLAKSQRDHFLEIVRPISKQCLGLLAGNHEGSILKHYERDIFADIVSEIKFLAGMKDDEPLAVGYSGWLKLKFKRKGSKTDRSLITVNLHHGFVGGKLAGAKALNMQRWLWSHEADLVIFGHSHNTGVQREAIELVNNADEIVTKDKVGCYSGTFMKTTQKGTTTYSEIKGYFPLPIGGVEIYLRPFTNGQKVRVMT